MPEAKRGISPDQMSPNKPSRHSGLNPEAAVRIQTELTDIIQKGPDGSPEIPVVVAAEKSYAHTMALKQRIRETEARIKDAKKRAKDLAKKAYTDSLTGVFNRRYLEETINAFNPKEDSDNLGVVFIDINFLKDINDTEGHATGDLLIKLTADILKEVFRSGDILSYLGDDGIKSKNQVQSENTALSQPAEEISTEEAKNNLISRLGGDEFVVLCHNYSRRADFKDIFTQAITDRLNKAISNYNQNKDKYEDKIEYPLLSVAIGTAVYNKDTDPEGISQTIGRAEAMMYKQKKRIHATRE